MLEMAAVAGFAAVSGALVMRLWSVPWERSQLLTICAGAVLGYFVADIASGVVHWFCDTFFHEDTPVIGRALIRPFREHHIDPLAITRHDFFEINGNSCLALLPLVTAVLIPGEPRAGEAVPVLFAQSAVVAFALATFATNQFHKWAHQPRPAAVVRWLQAIGIVLSPAHHSRHHSRPYRQAFCITAGWFDPLLDHARIFERIEHAVRPVPSNTSRGERRSTKPGVASLRAPANRIPEA